MSPFSPGYTALGTINDPDMSSTTHCPNHHSLYHLISVWSSKVLSLPNKVITALLWTLHNSSNATKTTLVFRASTSCSELILHLDLLGTAA